MMTNFVKQFFWHNNKTPWHMHMRLKGKQTKAQLAGQNREGAASPLLLPAGENERTVRFDRVYTTKRLL